MLLRARMTVARALGSGLPVKEANSLAKVIDPSIQASMYKSDQTISELRQESASLEQRFKQETESLEHKAASHASTEKELTLQVQRVEDFNKELVEKHAKALAQARVEADMKFEEKDELLRRLSMKMEADKKKMQEAAGEVAEVAEEHPVYGKLLCDLGHKKLYAIAAKALCDKSVMPIWEKQRIFREERSKAIAKAKRKDDRFGLPGVIAIFEAEGGKRGILDGQHRVGGLELLLQSGDWPEDKPIPVEVYSVSDEAAVADLFLEINQSQPVQELDLPGVADDNLRLAINETSDTLRAEFGDMFKHSTRCRAPHVNIDNLRSVLFNSAEVGEVVRAAMQDGDSASTALTEFVRDKNARLGERGEEEWGETEAAKMNKSFAKNLAKCQKFNFFLGLDKKWV